MRIAQVAPLYERVPPKLYGGTERIVSFLTEELVALGHEVTLFASGDSISSARLISACDKALRLDVECVDSVAPHVYQAQQVVKWRNDFDIIHFHNDYLHLPLARALNLVHITTQHGRLDLADVRSLWTVFSDLPMVSVSYAQRMPLPWLNWAGTVYHGLPQDHLAFQERPGHYLAFLGRFSPEKQPEHAIEIALRHGMPLKLAAKISQTDQVYFDRVIKPKLDHPLVEYVGEIGDHEKEDFLGNAFATLFPINWPEPFGLVMIESMACGTPVIAYPHGAASEDMENGVTGFLVSTTEEAVAALGRVTEKMRATARAAFERRFTARRMALEYLNLYARDLSIEPQQVVV